MENTENYIQVLDIKINTLILEQKEVYDEGILTKSCELDEERFNRFMEIQNQINHFQSLKNRSQDRAIQQICYNQLMRQNFVKDGRKSNEMGDYVFLTINPPDYIPYTRLVNAVKSFTSLCVCKWSVYVFEQRSIDENDYRGFHSHILFQRDRKPKEVQKAIDRIFYESGIVPDRNKMKHWARQTLDQVKGALVYMKGGKKDRDKLPKVENDTRMRSSYGLDPLYIVGDCPLLVRQSPDDACPSNLL